MQALAARAHIPALVELADALPEDDGVDHQLLSHLRARPLLALANEGVLGQTCADAEPRFRASFAVVGALRSYLVLVRYKVVKVLQYLVGSGRLD